MMSGVIPTVLSPARVSHALASVGPPAGSGGLRISSTDPLTPGNGIDTQQNGGGRAKSTSPSRAAATAFPISAISASSPLTADASQATTVPSPAAPYLTTPIHGPSGTTIIPIYRASGSGTGESSSAATSARSLNGRRPQTARSFRSRPDSPKTAGGRVLPAPDSSSASLSTAYGAYGGGGVLASPLQRALGSNGGNTRGSRGGLGRDRSFAGSVSSTTGQLRPQHGSLSGGFGSGLESMGAAVGGLARGGPMGLQPAPGTAGGIDIARLVAIQRLLDEYDSDDAADPGVTSPRAEGSSYRHRSDSAGGDSTRPQGSDSGSGTGSASGLRTIASLRSRKDMQHWQPSVSTAKGSLEEHQQRLRERADVTLHLKRWTEQVLEDARRAAEGGTSGRANEIVRAASVRFKDVPEDQGPSLTAALGEYLDPEQELDDEEERRMEALMALPPNPRGLGTQLRAHFMAVVEEEVNKKFDVMRNKWEAEKGIEAEELRELRESYRDLRRMHMETKEALDKANTRMDVMRLQMKATASISKTGKEGGSAATDTDTNTKSSLRGHRSSTHDGSEGKAGGKAGKGAGGHAAHTGDGGGAASPSPSPSGGYGHEDELHDKLRSIGSRRATSPTGDGSGATPGTAELQQQLKVHAESAMTLNRKLQDAEQQLLKLKLDKASLENQLTAARARGASPEPDSAAGTGPTGGGAGASAGKYDADVQIFKLKQEKASLEQQLAAAKAKSSGKVGAKGSSGGGSARSGSTSRALTAASAGKGAAASKTAELTADVERLQIELAAAKREAANSTKEAMERRMELQKAKDDLATTQKTLEMALQQIAGVKEAISQEKDRADKAVAAAEAAAAAQAQAEANAAAANSAVAAALIKRSAATGEVQELVERLEKERDAAVTAAAELRQQVRELSQSLGRQAEDVMQLREQLLQRQLEKPAPNAAPADAEVPPEVPPAASQPPPPAPGPPPVVAAAAGGIIPPMESKVTAAAMAAMQSLGLPLRPAPVAARRRPTSALGPGGSAGAGAFEGAVGVAAAAAAAAALVPAVLEVLQHRVPDMVMSLGGELEAGSAAAAPAEQPLADADGGGAASVNAAAAAAAAAAATLRESGNAAAAAAAGATAAAPIIASTFVDLVRAELMHSDANASAPGSGAAAAETATAGRSTAPSRPETIMAGATPGENLVSEQLDQLSALGSDRLYVFRRATPPTVVTPASAGGPSVSFADDSASPSPAATTPAGAADGVTGDRFSPPPAVVVDEVTFYPLGMRESLRTTRRSGAHSTILSGGHDLPPSPQRQTPSTPLPHHTPYFDAAAAAVAAAAADLIPQTVSVSVQSSRRTLVSSAVTAAARRRRSAFAQLHSNYLTPAVAAGSPPVLDPHSPHSTVLDWPIDEEGDGAAAEMAVTTAAAGGSSTGNRIHMIRSGGYYRDAADGALQDGYASVYVDPELASVLHVERVSPAAARAAGAGRGAISPEALGPSLRDRALSTLQAPEPLPAPLQRPQSAAVRTLDAARQFILQHGNGGGGRYSHPPHSLSAVLPPVAGAMPAAAAAAAAEAPGPAPAEGGGTSAAQPQQPGQLPLGLLMSGVKVRAVPANPQKGVQLSARLRAPRQPSARGVFGRSQAESVRFEDDEAAAAAGPSVSGRLVPGSGLGPAIREMQLHMGPQGGASSATYLVPSDPAGGGGGGGGHAGSGDLELPASGPELAALARGLMAAQERAVRELEEAMSNRRELAEEVLTSRQQWLDEARRARALEKELEGVRAVLVSLGIGAMSPGSAGGGGAPLAPPLLRASGVMGASTSGLPSLPSGGSP
ncbi:hypothetical protein VaNZ11_001255 [Volvox africanus]|uniref:Uncharacterized protein n=1 Tax=Volvox africanus TaxID=51714 RepID=A0ABQ5RQ60_9CHLO|nr:hypothetical protein VaNZ11_001255 [Volvox africanus]